MKGLIAARKVKAQQDAARRRNELKQVRDYRAWLAREASAYMATVRIEDIHGYGSKEHAAARRKWHYLLATMPPTPSDAAFAEARETPVT